MRFDRFPCFDPRDPWQRSDIPETWRPTGNPALVQATMALDLVPTKKIDWNEVAKRADLCEAPAAGHPALTGE